MNRVDLDNIENNRNNESSDSEKPMITVEDLLKKLEEELDKIFREPSDPIIIESSDPDPDCAVSVETAISELLGTGWRS